MKKSRKTNTPLQEALTRLIEKHYECCISKRIKDGLKKENQEKRQNCNVKKSKV